MATYNTKDCDSVVLPRGYLSYENPAWNTVHVTEVLTKWSTVSEVSEQCLGDRRDLNGSNSAFVECRSVCVLLVRLVQRPPRMRILFFAFYSAVAQSP